jgi:hypothetical protein
MQANAPINRLTVVFNPILLNREASFARLPSECSAAGFVSADWHPFAKRLGEIVAGAVNVRQTGTGRPL